MLHGPRICTECLDVYICGALMGACVTIAIVMYNSTIIPRWFKVNISSIIATVFIGVFDELSKMSSKSLADKWETVELETKI